MNCDICKKPLYLQYNLVWAHKESGSYDHVAKAVYSHLDDRMGVCKQCGDNSVTHDGLCYECWYIRESQQ